MQADRAELEQKFRALTQRSVDEQAKEFLKAFVLDFQGNFEEVLEIANEFKKYGPKEGPVVALPEFEAHLFLEKRGETLTVQALRENLKREITLERNHNVAFLEYALWKYHKTAHQMFKPAFQIPPELLAALEQAIANFEQTLAIRKAREERMAELERQAALGGVKAMAAKNQLEQMRSEDSLEQNRREVTSGAQKRKAQRAVEDTSKFEEEERRKREVAMQAESARLEEEKRQKAAADQKSKEDSRARLAARASLWGN
eukprot:TRINITY_DN608_c0_g2_i1.p2 TRINITY_DN608_c0_g2~~TRINITY_DN608_c0_g2_i1.p2  ORF type:complete len:259 (+),score=72.56 TRINITY_DN608_c0_g2_i1:15-791(+)